MLTEGLIGESREECIMMFGLDSNIILGYDLLNKIKKSLIDKANSFWVNQSSEIVDLFVHKAN